MAGEQPKDTTTATTSHSELFGLKGQKRAGLANHEGQHSTVGEILAVDYHYPMTGGASPYDTAASTSSNPPGLLTPEKSAELYSKKLAANVKRPLVPSEPDKMVPGGGGTPGFFEGIRSNPKSEPRQNFFGGITLGFAVADLAPPSEKKD